MKASPLFLSALLVSIMLHSMPATADAELPAAEKNTAIPVKATQKTFLKNMGQWSSEILYDGSLPDGKVRFLKSGLSFGISISTEEDDDESNVHTAISFEPSTEKDSVQIFNLIFKNSNSTAIIKGKEEQASVVNFINNYGNFPHVPESNSILYAGIYNNIDIEYYKTTDARFEYDVVLKPGAKASDLFFSYDGIKSVNINGNGELLINTGRLTLIENMPLSYQNINGTIVEVAVKYKLLNNTSYGFEITGANYNPAYDLIIDPFMRRWGTYLRASLNSYAYDNTVDTLHNVYLTGWIEGQYPTTSGTLTASSRDAYIAKLKPNGDDIIYYTMIGGPNVDQAYSIAVDSLGAAYITGNTLSSTFPQVGGGFGTTFGGSIDCFVTKVDPFGTSLIYSKFLGGTNAEIGFEIKLNKTTLAAYVTGATTSGNFPVTGGVIQSGLNGISDAFVSCVEPSGTNLLFSTYYGGNNGDASSSLYIDNTTNDIYIAGRSQSTDVLATGVFQNVNRGLNDGFVAKLNPTCSAIIYETYIGSSENDIINAIDVNANGEVFAIGETGDNVSSIFHFPITPGVIQSAIPAVPDGEGFVVRFNNTVTGTIYSTYLGGSSDDHATDIKVNNINEAYVCGYTTSADFPIQTPAFQGIMNSSMDFFLSHLTNDGRLTPHGDLFACGGSTFIGGNDNEYHIPKLSLEKNGPIDTLYFSGTSHSLLNFPTTAGTYQPTKTNGSNDQPIALKLGIDPCPFGDPRLVIDDLINEDTVCAGSCFVIKAAIISGFPTPNNLQVNFPGATINYYNQDTLRITICPVNPGNLHLLIFQNLNLANYPPTTLDFTVLPAPPPFNLGPDKLICPGSAVTLSTPPLTGITYLWTGPGVTGTSSAHVSVTAAGTYILRATNAAGCSVSDTIKLFTLDDMPNTFITYTNCYVPIGVQLNAGQGAVSYSWSPVAGLSNPLIQNPVATPAVTTTYTVIATFANGCVDTGDVVVTVPPVPVYSIGGPLTVCEGSCIKFTVPRELCVGSAVWFYSHLHPFPNNTDVYLGSGNTICVTVKQSGNYCVKIITCDGCEYLLCRQITVVTGKACKNLPVTDDRCCTISTGRFAPSTEQDNVAVFAVYPNPANGTQLQLTFETKDAASVKISLLNALGQLQSVLLNENASANSTYERTVDISKLSTGIYFISMESDGVTKTIKFVRE